MAKSALRVLEIMEYVAREERGATHAQIARDLRIPKSSLTALLKDLQGGGYLALDGETARYSIGTQVLVLAQAYLRGLNIVKLGQPVVASLFKQLDEFTALGIQRDGEYILVCAESPASPLAHSLQIGERGPMYCSATGKAILAHLPEAEAMTILTRHPRTKRTPATKTELSQILSELDEVRRTGIGYAREETLLGITAIAAPIFNAAGRAIAALSVALPTARLDPDREAEIVRAVRRSARDLSANLGWQGEAEPRRAQP